MTDRRRLSDRQLKGVVHVTTSRIHGTGLFASRYIEEGEYIGTFAGPEAHTDGVHVLWVYQPDSGTKAVGRAGRNLLRFLNHASPCNAQFHGFDLYATDAIPRDVEITIDYGGAP